MLVGPIVLHFDCAWNNKFPITKTQISLVCVCLSSWRVTDEVLFLKLYVQMVNFEAHFVDERFMQLFDNDVVDDMAMGLAIQYQD